MAGSARARSRRAAGELETAVLAAMWSARVGGETGAKPSSADVWLTPNEVQTRLASSGAELAYNSVMTTLVRLHAKGLAERRHRGRAWEYRPAERAVEHAAEQMQSLLGAGPARALVLSHFVAGLRREDEEVLQRLLGDDEAETPGDAR
jgi:predicted transcriptional regulator